MITEDELWAIGRATQRAFADHSLYYVWQYRDGTGEYYAVRYMTADAPRNFRLAYSVGYSVAQAAVIVTKA